MADLKICSIGNSSCGSFIDFEKNASLDEYDIINIFPFTSEKKDFTYRDEKIYRLIQSSNLHWLQQSHLIKDKLIIVCLQGKNIFSLRPLSGTSFQTNNYTFLSFLDSNRINNYEGKEVVAYNCPPSIKNLYEWLKTKEVFGFQVYLNQDNYSPLFFTKNKNNKLGGFYKDTENNNIYLLLPAYNQDIVSYRDNSTEYAELLKGIYNEFFTEQQLDQPEWVKNNPDYLSSLEKDTQDQISENQKKIDDAKQKIKESMQIINSEQNLKTLLYAQSHELEKGIIEAMAVLGFNNPHTYSSENCEIDIVCDEKDNPGFLLIGEAEGAAKGTVNSKKINQVYTHEATYIEENNVDIDAISITKVLFGNAFTSMPLEQRTEYFGPHVYKIAKLQKIKLVRTPDLFNAALYIKNSQDIDYAKKCRELFFDDNFGIINFPNVL